MELPLNKKQRVIKRITDGEEIETICRDEDVGRRTIGRWFAEFQDSGCDIRSVCGSSSIRRYQQLSAGQIRWLYHSLVSKCPYDFGLRNRLWTRNIILELVKHWCLSTQHNADLYLLLSELGFEFTNPLATAFKTEFQPLQNWLKNELDQIYIDAKKAGAQVFCLGERELRSCFQVIADQGRKGSTIVRHAGDSTNYRLVFAFSQQRKGVRFLVNDGVMDISSAIEFMERFSSDFARPAFLIVQKGSSFSSVAVKRHVRRNLPLLQLFTLPVKLA